MPNSINIPTPPHLMGDPEAKLAQLHSYLFRLSEQLAMILNSIETVGTALAGSAQTGSSARDIYAVREDLRRQIVDTASALRKEADAMESELQAEIEGITLSALGVRRGTTDAVTLAAGAHSDIAVSFAALADTPIVVAGITGAGESAECQVITGSISKSGFTVRITNRASTEQTYSVAWIAVGG